MSRTKKPLEAEIELMRHELYEGSDYFQNDRKLDTKTYALSLKMDKLIIKYMKKEETQK